MRQLRASRVLSITLWVLFVMNVKPLAQALLEHETPIVTVPGLAKFRGFTNYTYLTKRPYSAFLGIPYGKIAKRFLPADEVTSYEQDLFDATIPQIPCIQPPNVAVPESGNGGVEDCLTLNIFTSRSRSSSGQWKKKLFGKKRPVIFFIHGGSFVRWSGNMWGAGRLLEKDAVLVTINYRLGPLGFFSLGVDDCPGDAGIYDMVLALKFVRKHISHFGGDPDLITIVGESAGAVSVTWDSPLAKGLFQRAIAMSGADEDVWGLQPIPVQATSLGANSLGCLRTVTGSNVTDVTSTMQCLRGLPASKFNEILGSYYTAPNVQSYPLTIEKVLPLSPPESAATGSQAAVPLIIGTTKSEGSFLLSRTYITIHSLGLDTNPEFLRTKLIPTILTKIGMVDSPPGYFDQLASKYLGSAKDSGNFTEMIPGLIDLFSSFYFTQGAYNFVIGHSNLSPDTYLYSFEYFGNQTYYPYIGGVPQIPRGVAHVDDLMYIFDQGEFTNSDDYHISKFMIDSFVNFANTGNPNKKFLGFIPVHNVWPQFDKAKQNFLRINTVLTQATNYPEYWKGVSNNGIQS